MDGPQPFYFIVTCVECDEDVYYGLNITTIMYNDLPAIPIDMAGEFSVRCSEGHVTQVCSPETFREGGI